MYMHIKQLVFIQETFPGGSGKGDKFIQYAQNEGIVYFIMPYFCLLHILS